MQEVEFKLPRMGESITEGTILNWVVEEGASFDEGDVLVEVATDKVDNEIPAPASGVLVKHLCATDDIVPVGNAIAVLQLTEKAAVGKKFEENKIERFDVEKPSKTNKKRKAIATNVRVNENLFVSPLVDAMAREHHISYEELARIPSTGKDGRLRKSDVQAYLDDGRPYQFAQVATDSGFSVPDLQFDKGEGKRVKVDRMRKLIADHMVFSKHTSPHVTAYVEADLTNMVRWRNSVKTNFKKKFDEKLTFTPLFIECIARAIVDFPMINTSMDGDEIIVKEQVNIGMATALRNGNLIVPVVKDADKKGLQELASVTNDLANRARENKLTSDDTSGGTFTISNVGTFGSLMGTPIINQPEAAILATGIIKKRAEVIEGESGDTIEIRSMMYLSLSFDHRIVDGYLAGSFLRTVANYMEEFDNTRKI